MGTKKKKSKRGGARAGAGRPVSTGPRATPPVSFRLSTAESVEAESYAGDFGITVGRLAKEAFLAAMKRGFDKPQKSTGSR